MSPKIGFPGGGGAGGGGGGVSDHGDLAGLAGDDHPQYLLTDGTRIADGLVSTSGLVPTTSGTAHIGTEDFPFSSGVFNERVLVSGIGFEDANGVFNMINANGNQTNASANTFTAGANGVVRWSGRGRFGSPSGDVIQTQDLNGNVGAAHLEASGIIIQSPDNSRFLISVDDAGALSTLKI